MSLEDLLRKVDFLPENCEDLDCDFCPEEPLCREIIADSIEFFVSLIPLFRQVKKGEEQK